MLSMGTAVHHVTRGYAGVAAVVTISPMVNVLNVIRNMHIVALAILVCAANVNMVII